MLAATGLSLLSGGSQFAGRRRRIRLGALHDLVNLVGKQTVRLPVDRYCRVGARRFGQAEDLGIFLVDPVTQILHPILILGLQIGPVCADDIFDRRSLGQRLMYVDASITQCSKPRLWERIVSRRQQQSQNCFLWRFSSFISLRCPVIKLDGFMPWVIRCSGRRSQRFTHRPSASGTW